MTLIGSVRTGMQSVRTGAEMRREKSAMEIYVEQLGKLIASLHELEIWLRVFLFGAEGHAKPGVDLYKVKVGDVFAENSMTDYDSLGALIARFNGRVEPADGIPKDELVTLRDALAHGRIFSNSQLPPFKLATFHRPKDGVVVVKGVENLDAAWLEAKANLVKMAFAKVFGSTFMAMLAPKEEK